MFTPILTVASMLLLLQMLLQPLLVSAQQPPPEDIMSVFDWSFIDCNQYDFGKAGGYNKCGVLSYCVTAAGLHGYRQEYSNQPCTTPGPVIRVEPNVRYLLTLKNTIPGVTTNIHPHGAHVHGDGNADFALRTAAYEECIHYNLLIIGNSMGGTFWYHSHYHTQARVQVGFGALGLFIVEDKYDTLIPAGLPGTAGIRSFLKNEKLIFGSKVNGTWYGNGNPAGAHVTIYQNEWTRIRVAVSDPIGSATSIQASAGICEEVLVIAYDGTYTFQVPGSPLPQSLTGGSRVDLAVRCSKTGTEVLTYGVTKIGYITIVPGSSVGTTLDVPPTPYSVNGTVNMKWNTTRPDYVRDLSTATVNNYMDFYARTDETGLINPPFLINNKSFSLTDINVIANNTLGDINEWTLYGTDRHPMHLHVQHYQLLSPCGKHEVGEYYDTIEGDNCLVRFGLYDFGGVTLIHCHDLSHEDAGMIGVILVNGDDKILKTYPAPDDKKCYIPPDGYKVIESSKCFENTKALRCTTRFGKKDGRWVRKGEVGRLLCRERCITDQSFDESTNRLGWKCGRCRS